MRAPQLRVIALQLRVIVLQLRNGDEATLLGDGISAEERAAWAGTIPHDILAGINTRVPRVYVGTEYVRTTG